MSANTTQASWPIFEDATAWFELTLPEGPGDLSVELRIQSSGPDDAFAEVVVFDADRVEELARQVVIARPKRPENVRVNLPGAVPGQKVWIRTRGAEWTRIDG